MSGRARSILALICVLGAGLVTACGGSSAPAGPSPVSLLLTAPNDGAIVSVRTIELIGQVTTKGAVVRINHHRAHLTRGTFKHTFSLHHGLNRIHVVATARGYKRTSINVAVLFRPAASQAAVNDFLISVNTACTKLGTGIQRLPRMTSAAVLRYDLTAQSQLQQRFVTELQAIHAPHDYAAGYARFTRLVQQTVSASRLANQELVADHISEVRALLPKINRLANQALNLGDTLGFQSCDAIVFPSSNG